MSAVAKANDVVAGLGFDSWMPCVCGGRWWYDGEECGAATHAAGCVYAELEPPTFNADEAVAA